MRGVGNYGKYLIMKQYVIDELRLDDYKKIKDYLDQNYEQSGFDGLYRIPLDPSRYSDTQMRHSECQPHYFAVELAEDRLACELLVRTNGRIRCDCIEYATVQQREWLIRLIDSIFSDLEIIT